MSQPDYLISTPENVDLHLEFAGLGNRVLACLIDTVLSYIAMIALIFIAISGNFLLEHAPLIRLIRATLSLTLTLGTIIGIFLIYFGYYIYFESSWQGQTPGKKIAGIRVIEENGQPVSRSSVWIRNLLRTIDQGFLLVGLLVMIIDRHERRLGDLAANTIVIRERAETYHLIVCLFLANYPKMMLWISVVSACQSTICSLAF